jgi:ribonuclease HI
LVKLNAVARKKFGLPGRTHKFLYERAILPIITYGAIVWGQAIERKYNLKLLESLNRLAGLGMTNCLRTTSTDALLVIAGLQPIEFKIYECVAGAFFNIKSSPDLQRRLELEETTENHLKTATHSSPLFFGQRVCPAKTGNFPQRAELTRLRHPARKIAPKIVLLDKAGAVDKVLRSVNSSSLYTDASKQGDSPIGCAVVGWDGVAWVEIGSDTLHPWESVFRGELRAIELALAYIERHQQPLSSVVIFSDSRSSLQAIKDVNNQASYILDIHEVLDRLERKRVSVELSWLPSHSQIEGNEAADVAAKAATEKKTETGKQSLWSKSRLVRTTKAENKLLWGKSWTSAEKGRFTYSIFPKVTNELAYSNTPDLSKKERVFLRRAAAGHFSTRVYLHRFRLTEDQTCRLCKTNEETIFTTSNYIARN